MEERRDRKARWLKRTAIERVPLFEQSREIRVTG